MRRVWYLSKAGAVAMAVCAALAGCGGGSGGSGGSASNLAVAGGGSSPRPGVGTVVTTQTGVVRFNLFRDALVSLVTDNGTVLTPVNPPPSLFDGERVRFTYTAAQTPGFVQPQFNPVRLIAFSPL